MKTLSTVLLLIFAAIAAVAGWFGIQQKNLAADAQAKLSAAMSNQSDDSLAARGALEAEIANLKAQLTAAKAESSLPGAPVVPSSELDDLKAQLAAKDQQIARLRVEPTGPGAEAAPRENQPEVSREDRRAQEMARMKREDPQAYNEMIQRRTETRVEMKQGLDERLKFYKGIDLTGLPPETVARHQQLMATLDKMSSTFAAMSTNPEGNQNFGDLREQMQGMGELMQEQRGILMQDLAADLGLEGQASDELLDTIDYIRQMTTPPRPTGGRGGPGGGRGGR